jgi:uncharacterized membrane protein|tara:strand:- start:20 stop:553 length:534 start_codon:yes stop_codon:yes gene_type:complete
MKSYLKKSLVLILFGFILHILFISYFHVGMLWVFDRETGANDTVNTVLLHTDTATSDTRGLKRPSSDVMYSICTYDVKYKPLIITTPIPDSYWSISFYSKNTDNYVTLNDLDIENKYLKVYLVGINSQPKKVSNGMVVVSPSDTGYILIRMFVGNGENLQQLKDFQESLSCIEYNDI